MTFVMNLIHDMKAGRESWRVLVAGSTVSFLVAIVVASGH